MPTPLVNQHRITTTKAHPSAYSICYKAGPKAHKIAAIKWKSARCYRQHETMGLAFQRAGLGHSVNERHKERGKKREHITSVF